MIEPGLWDMVLSLRSRGISDTHVLEAVETTPRSRFVPEELRMHAYDEAPLPLPCAQEMLPPLLCAQILQLAEIGRDRKVLVVGVGSGWLAGLAARMGARTYGVERFATLMAKAEENFARAGLGLTLRWGDGLLGWPSQAPFDRILLGGAVEDWPRALISQLAPEGRIVGVRNGKLAIWQDGTRDIMPAAAPFLQRGRSHVL